MRRTTILAARSLIVALFLAALLDVPLPATSRARVRVHLVDRSRSVLVEGPSESLNPEDAGKIIAWDRRPEKMSEDTIIVASFAANVAFESAGVDAGSTDLAGAIRAALLRNPTEIVLWTDGRADPGDALLLCKARSVPVHVFPLGPVEVRDARIVRVDAPGFAAPGDPFTIEIAVQATFDGPVRVHLDAESRDFDVRAGVPALVPFPGRKAGPFRARVEAEKDACPENNEAAGEVFPRTGLRKVLALSARKLEIPGVDVRSTPRFENPQPYAAVILDNIDLAPPEMRALEAYVRDFGGGLLLLGGPRSYASGGWAGTPIEAVSPLDAFPDDRLAIVFAIDSSGSMSQEVKFEAVRAAVEGARGYFRPTDHVIAMTFSDVTAFYPNLDGLSRVKPSGPTYIARGIDEARLHLEQQRAGRKHLLMITDGEASEKEKPEERRAALGRLDKIGFTLVTTNKSIENVEPVKIEDYKKLSDVMKDIVRQVQGLMMRNPGALEPRPHAVRVPPGLPAIMNLTAAKPGAEIAAMVGRYPAVAFHPSGRGRVGAFAFDLDSMPAGLLARSIEHVSAESGGLTLSIDPPFVRARGRGQVELRGQYQTSPSQESGSVLLDQVGPETWEGRLPATKPGTIFVKVDGGAVAAATIPCAREFEALGVDRTALRRIAEETGGKVLGRMGDLDVLPRPGRREHRSGRTFFLIAALVLLFAEMAISTFWKA